MRYFLLIIIVKMVDKFENREGWSSQFLIKKKFRKKLYEIKVF